MDGTLKISAVTLAYADKTGTSNPQKKYVDWTVNRSYSVQNPKSVPLTLAPGEVNTVFSGSRNIVLNANTVLGLSLVSGTYNTYRLSYASGNAPGFRTDRGLAENGKTLTLTANPNLTLTVASTTADFGAVVVGDTVFFPSTPTGDAAGPFSPLNVGLWSVLSVAGDSKSIQLARPTGVDFSGTTETVTVTDNSQIQAYSAAGVQVGDKVQISAGFAAPVLGTYQVTAVTASRFDFVSVAALPTGITAQPGTGLSFYSASKRYIRVEADQLLTLALNGDTSGALVLNPWSPGDEDNTGFFELCGNIWSCVLTNNNSVSVDVLVITAE